MVVRARGFGKIEFWVDDHHRRRAVMVECDDPQHPVIAALPFKDAAGEQAAREKAAKLLARCKSGKVDYRAYAARVAREFQWSRSIVEGKS